MNDQPLTHEERIEYNSLHGAYKAATDQYGVGRVLVPPRLEELQRRAHLHASDNVWQVRLTHGSTIHGFDTEAEAQEFADGIDQSDAAVEVHRQSREERNAELEAQARAERDFTDAAKILVDNHGYTRSDLDDMLELGHVTDEA